MAPYSTSADVQIAAGGETKLIQLSDIDSEQEINAAQVTAAIEEADGVIDAYIGKRWATPLTAPGTAIKWISARLSVIVLKIRRNMATERDMENRALIIEELENIAMGKSLPATTDTPTGTSPEVKDDQVDPSEKRDFERTNLRGFW